MWGGAGLTGCVCVSEAVVGPTFQRQEGFRGRSFWLKRSLRWGLWWACQMRLLWAWFLVPRPGRAGLHTHKVKSYSQHEVLLPAGLAASYSNGSALHVLHLQRHVCVELLCSGRAGQWPAVSSWVRILTSTRRVDQQTRVPEPPVIIHS